MRKIVIALSKGGVGKTTTAVNLSAGLALQGYRVLLVDTDTQDQITSVLGVAPEYSLVDLVDGVATADSVLVEARPNLFLISGGAALSGLQRTISRMEIGGEAVLSQALAPLESRFDFIILDTSPGWDSVSINVLFYANEVLTPVSLEAMTLQTLLRFLERIEMVKVHNPALALRYVVPTFLDGRVRKSQEILDQLKRHFEDLVCEPIRYNVKVSEAPGVGQTIFEYDPISTGAKDYTKLIERIVT